MNDTTLFIMIINFLLSILTFILGNIYYKQMNAALKFNNKVYGKE
jgi:hypothetical protein